METTKISKAAPGQEAAQQPAPCTAGQQAGNGAGKLSEAFLALLGQMLGTFNTSQLMNSETILNFGAIQTPPPVEEPVKKEEPAPAAEEEQVGAAPAPQEADAQAPEEDELNTDTEENADAPVEEQAAEVQEEAVVALPVQTAEKPAAAPAVAEQAPEQSQPQLQQLQQLQQMPQQAAAGEQLNPQEQQIVQQAAKPVKQQQQQQQTEAQAQTVGAAPAAQEPAAVEAATAEAVKQSAPKGDAEPVSRQTGRAGDLRMTAEQPVEEMPAAAEPAAPAPAPAEETAPKKSAAESAKQQQFGIPAAGVEAALERAGTGSSAGQGSAINGVSGPGESRAAANHERQAAVKGKKNSQSLPPQTQDNIIERIKEMLKNAEQQRQGNSLVMQLDPPELGSMTLKVTRRESSTFVRIVPESAEVEATLRQRANELVQVLSSAGFNPKNVHISIGAERSETEMYQFHQFLKGNGGNSQQESAERSYRGDNTRFDHAAECMLPKSQADEAAGWVA